jgi:hypothetical protein
VFRGWRYPLVGEPFEAVLEAAVGSS